MLILWRQMNIRALVTMNILPYLEFGLYAPMGAYKLFGSIALYFIAGYLLIRIGQMRKNLFFRLFFCVFCVSAASSVLLQFLSQHNALPLHMPALLLSLAAIRWRGRLKMPGSDDSPPDAGEK